MRCLLLFLALVVWDAGGFLVAPSGVSSSASGSSRRAVTAVDVRRPGRVESAAQKLQDARKAEDLLDCTHEFLSELKVSHVSGAVLRIAKDLLQPKDDARREAIRADPRLPVLVDTCVRGLLGAPSGRHAADLVVGLALLGLPAQAEWRGVWEGLDGRLGDVSTEDVSSLSWAWERLRPAEPVPGFLWEAVEGLPFRVLIGALEQERLDVQTIVSEVDLRKDTITLGSKQVAESRLTGWEGPYPFAYSGKVMPPAAVTPTVARVRDRLHALTGVYYDCCLINLYPDGKSAMRYHVDPDQGVYWTEHTCVVSVGDTREFVIRELGDYSRRHRFFVSGGDVVYMFADCQERYQHAVRVCEEAEDAGPRVSLVYKQSLEQGKRP